MTQSLTTPDPAISIVVPAYNEAESVAVLAAEIEAAMAGAGLAYEVLWVDDGSTDATPEVLRALAAADPVHRVFRVEPNQGQSAALVAGWRAARAQVVVTMDADLQNDPADVPRLLAALEEGYDVVSGVRTKRRDSAVRRLSSRLANGVRNRLTGAAVTDVGCTLRACRVELLRDIPVFNGMHRFLPTLLEMRGARLGEVPVGHRPRRYGVTKYGINNRLWRGLVDIWGVRWLQRRAVNLRVAREVTPAPGLSPDSTE